MSEPCKSIDVGDHRFELITIGDEQYVHGHPQYGPFTADLLPQGVGVMIGDQVTIECDHTLVATSADASPIAAG